MDKKEPTSISEAFLRMEYCDANAMIGSEKNKAEFYRSRVALFVDGSKDAIVGWMLVAKGLSLDLTPIPPPFSLKAVCCSAKSLVKIMMPS